MDSQHPSNGINSLWGAVGGSSPPGEWFRGDRNGKASREGKGGFVLAARLAKPTLAFGGLADGAARLSHQPGATN